MKLKALAALAAIAPVAAMAQTTTGSTGGTSYDFSSVTGAVSSGFTSFISSNGAAIGGVFALALGLGLAIRLVKKGVKSVG